MCWAAAEMHRDDRLIITDTACTPLIAALMGKMCVHTHTQVESDEGPPRV